MSAQRICAYSSVRQGIFQWRGIGDRHSARPPKALDLLSAVNMAVARIYSTSITMREIESQFKKAVRVQKILLLICTVSSPLYGEAVSVECTTTRATPSVGT